MEAILIAIGLFVGLPLALLVLTNVNIAISALILILPFYNSILIPRQMFGITGLNPFNLAIIGLIAAIIYSSLNAKYRIVIPKFSPIIYSYILPIALYALYGVTQIGNISPYFVASQFNLSGEQAIEFLSVGGYLSIMLLKPLVLIVMSYVVAVSVASFQVEIHVRTLTYVAAALVPVSLITGLAVQGLGLGDISSAQDRGSLSWFGMHANELGLMLNIAFALALFGFFHNPPVASVSKLGSLLLLLLSVGVMITFSRGAMVAYFLIVMIFMARRGIRPGQLIIIPGLLVGLLLLPDEIFERLFTGVDSGDIEEISAGRVDNIWLPLLPTIFDNFLVGGGLGSIMWSVPMKMGYILPVGHAHSAYLGLLLDFGLIGSVIILYFWWRVWELFGQVASQIREWRGFFIGAKVGIVVIFLQGITDDRFTPTASQVFIWVAIGLAIGLSCIKSRVNSWGNR